MAKELMEIGGFITSGAEIVNHDASLSGNGTVESPLGADVDTLKRLLGIDETVLFSGTGLTGNYSEPLSNFKKVEFHFHDDTNIQQCATLYPDEQTGNVYIVGGASVWQPGASPVRILGVSGNMNSFTRDSASYQWWSKNDGGYASFGGSTFVVIGINRIANN